MLKIVNSVQTFVTSRPKCIMGVSMAFQKKTRSIISKKTKNEEKNKRVNFKKRKSDRQKAERHYCVFMI